MVSTMSDKPRVCVIDENLLVKVGWERSLGHHADLFFYRDHRPLLEEAAKDPTLIPSFHCIIVGRIYPHINVDIVNSEVPDKIRKQAMGPVFLNWQGYVSKGDLDRSFDGKIFHRYGIKWHTLRLRIQRVERKKGSFDHVHPTTKQRASVLISRSQKCCELLKTMASRADGQHRRKIEMMASSDPETGIKLLEAIYNKLLVDKNRPANCPSRYINSSPVIAARILREVLNGASSSV